MPDVSHTTDDWARLSALLDEALTIPAEQRDVWVAGLSRDDARLKSSLRALIARAGADTDDFMRKPVRLRGTLAEDAAEGVAAQPGAGVGPYRLLREIGSGGMAAVWLAERADGVPKRRVALKLPRLSWDTPGLAQRMARERDILAQLEHPNIARLYDAGVDSHGRPYLAMEYVEGRPLDRYCDDHDLGLGPRLQLFLQIARAVAHAHAHLIVHRDLKPSNLLVSSDGNVHLLDFGIAKIIEGDPGAESAPETHLTRIAGRALTPEYAAPEQIRGEAITVGVDIYSLGIVLYELVTGRRPYRLDVRSSAELSEAVLTQDVPHASSVAVDHRRAADLRGDLDTILAKALKKSPSERYSTADAFAADVQRHLDGSPVLARPDSLAYRASRFARRHKVPVTLAGLTALAVVGGAAPVAAVMVALTAGVGAALWQAGIARRQADRAAEEARQAQRERDRAMRLLERHDATLEFMQVMLTEAAAADEKMTLNELLARSERIALVPNASQPELAATVLNALGSLYVSFGNYGKAESTLRRAADLIRTSPDVTLRAAIECNHALAVSECGNVEIARQTIESWLAVPEVEPSVAARCQQYLAEIARNHSDAKGALTNIQGAIARLRDPRDRRASFEASLAGDLAFAYFLNGRFADADREYARAMQLHREIGREESPIAVAILNNWGMACNGSGNVRRALEINEEVLRLTTKRAPNGTPPPYVVNNYASTLASLARYDEAWEAAERTVHVSEQAGATPFKLNARVIQAIVMRERGDLDAASRILAEVAPAIAELSLDNFAVIGYRQGIANIALRRGRYDEAADAIEPIVALFESRGMTIGILANALRLRAEIRCRKGDHDAALKDARRALEMAQALCAVNAHSTIVGMTSLALARIEREAGHTEAFEAALVDAVEHLAGAFGEDHPETRRARELAASTSGHSAA